MTWRVAGCLEQLLAEINASAPNRSKASDGSIGDAAHQAQGSASDHNPWCNGWVVTARDFTHDPDSGFDSYSFADWLRARCAGDIRINGRREIRVKYIISNRRIASSSDGFRWRVYRGTSDPHTNHVHVSVDCTDEGGYMDSREAWGWHGDADVRPTVVPFPYSSIEYLGRSGAHHHDGCNGGIDSTNVRTWQQRMRDRGWSISVDGCYGPQSEAVAVAFQREKSLGADGLVGPKTWQAAWLLPVT